MLRESYQTALAARALKVWLRSLTIHGGSLRPQDNWAKFGPADRFLLDQVYDAAWAVIQAHDPFRDLNQDEQLQFALREKLFVLATNGERDPQTLRSLLLADMPLGEPQTIGCLSLKPG